MMLYLFDDCFILPPAPQERESGRASHTKTGSFFGGGVVGKVGGGWQFAEGGGMAHCVSGLSAREAFRAMAKTPHFCSVAGDEGEGRGLCNFPPLPFSGKHTHPRTHILITAQFQQLSALHLMVFHPHLPRPLWPPTNPGSGLFVSGTYPRWILLICAAHPSWIDKWYIIFPAQSRSRPPSRNHPLCQQQKQGGKTRKIRKTFFVHSPRPYNVVCRERFRSDDVAFWLLTWRMLLLLTSTVRVCVLCLYCWVCVLCCEATDFIVGWQAGRRSYCRVVTLIIFSIHLCCYSSPTSEQRGLFLSKLFWLSF